MPLVAVSNGDPAGETLAGYCPRRTCRPARSLAQVIASFEGGGGGGRLMRLSGQAEVSGYLTGGYYRARSRARACRS